jgi:aerobic carbon-monoxide dehydrogenase small subunit
MGAGGGMTPVQFTVNGRAVVETVEARTHLADFVREKLNLTGTHLRCEQGVCGACTLLIDGQPARSCITYAVMCDGATVTTIEGLEHDPVMAALRRAFREEHGVQCGFCTPGMLITGRDIVTRLPDADEARIRLELSGNLCRCTGYVGIVRAIDRVLKARRAGALAAAPVPGAVLGPVGARRARPAAQHSPGPAAASVPAATDDGSAQNSLGLAGRQPNIELRQSLSVSCPPQEVWTFLGDIGRVVRCLPGASLTEAPQAENVRGKFSVKLGPIAASFSGEARIIRDDASRRGLVLGAGSDPLSGSRAAGEIEYVVLPASEGARVEIAMRAALAGPLAQFSRAGIVDDLVARIVEAFARNLEASLTGREAEFEARANAPLQAGALLRQVLMARLRAVLARVFGRGGR